MRLMEARPSQLAQVSWHGQVPLIIYLHIVPTPDDRPPVEVMKIKIEAAGPVSRILSALRRDGHSSGLRITAQLKRPTRRFLRAPRG